MTKTDIAKTVVAHITSAGVGMAATAFIQNNRQHSDNKAAEFALDVTSVVTAYAVAELVRDAVRETTNKKIDDIVSWWDMNINRNF